MANNKHNWDEIISDCAEIIADIVAKGENIPSTFPALYHLIETKYQNEGKIPPKQNTFRQVMHDRLKIGNNQKNISAALYRLAGRYDKMTLAQLTENITLTSRRTEDKTPWIFIRLNGSDVSMTDKAGHLYHLSHELKEKFSKQILFASFDIDTIVILCHDDEARKTILEYFEESAVCGRITIDRGDDNGNESNV